MFTAKDLGKRFLSPAGETWALRHVSFTLPNRGLVAIKGASGSGKSTLLNLLATLESPDEGELSFNGRPLSHYRGRAKENLRNFSFGFLYQHFNLLEEYDGLSNVEMPLLLRGLKRKEAEEKALALFKQFRLSDLGKKKAKFLSGGEKQRVALLRALIVEPDVIFADEPTGALDEANETLVMDELKRQARNRLVIFVSHNERLIKKYAERLLALEDGELVGDSDPDCLFCQQELRVPKRQRHSYWFRRLLQGNYEKNLGKNLLSFLAGTIGYGALLLSAAFYLGSNDALANEKRRTLLYPQASLSEKVTYPVKGSPLTLTKHTRPSREKAAYLLRDYPSVSLENDYSYFVPAASTYLFEEEERDPVNFAPLFDVTLEEFGSSLLKEGARPNANTLEEAVVNEEFASLYSFSVVGKTVHFEKTMTVTAYDASDVVSIGFDFKITGVVKEFSFLNTPRLYYSYAALRGYFQSFYLPKISQESGQLRSVDDLVSEALGDETYCSYAFLCFAHDLKGAEGLRYLSGELKEEEATYAVTSAAATVEKAFSSLRDALSASLIPFLVIEVLAVAFIMGSLAYSSFLENRKEAAILLAMGARGADVSLLYLSESLFSSFLSAVLALGLVPFLEKAFNPFLEGKTGVAQLLELPLGSFLGIPLLVEGALFLLALILASLGAGLPLAIAKRRPMAESLRDE